LTGQAVTDSTCLIALERIGQLDLLPQLFAAVFAPPAVQAELGSPLEWLVVRAASDLRVITALKTQLDEGEAEAIALAMELGDVSIILDDKKARRVARQVGLAVVGTVGILLRAKRRGVLATVAPLLATLHDTGFHIAPTLYCEALRLANEEVSE
jgi:predicted nucleic acid-binding protein